MSDMSFSYSNLSKNFTNELRKAAADGKITNSEVRNLLSKAEAPEDISIVKAFAIFDNSKINVNVNSGTSSENFELDIEDHNFSTNEDNSIISEEIKLNNKQIIIRYATDNENISPYKQTKGEIKEANDKIDSILPPEKKEEWNKINKYNVSEVKSFINNLNLPMDKKAELVSAYLTANYNHPGIDISWGGLDLQEGINAVPNDKDGRKYLDCEAYSKLATELLGGSFKEYGVHAPNPNDPSTGRNHQVAVVRDENNAYVISNNEITKVEINGKSDNDLIKSVYKDFSNIKEDKSGAMKSGVDEYDVKQKVKLKNDSTVTITKIDENNNIMKGKLKEEDGKQYDVVGTVDPNTGETTWIRDYKVGDKIRSGSQKVTLTDKIDDKTFKGKVNGKDVLFKVNEDGSYVWFHTYKKGDKISTPNGFITIDKVLDNKNENFEATFTKFDGSKVSIKLKRGDDGLLYP